MKKIKTGKAIAIGIVSTLLLSTAIVAPVAIIAQNNKVAKENEVNQFVSTIKETEQFVTFKNETLKVIGQDQALLQAEVDAARNAWMTWIRPENRNEGDLSEAINEIQAVTIRKTTSTPIAYEAEFDIDWKPEWINNVDPEFQDGIHEIRLSDLNEIINFEWIDEAAANAAIKTFVDTNRIVSISSLQTALNDSTKNQAIVSQIDDPNNQIASVKFEVSAGTIERAFNVKPILTLKNEDETPKFIGADATGELNIAVTLAWQDLAAAKKLITDAIGPIAADEALDQILELENLVNNTSIGSLNSALIGSINLNGLDPSPIDSLTFKVKETSLNPENSYTLIPTVTLLPGYGPSETFVLEEITDLAIKLGSFYKFEEIAKTTIQDLLFADKAITDLTTLQNWLDLPANQKIISDLIDDPTGAIALVDGNLDITYAATEISGASYTITGVVNNHRDLYPPITTSPLVITDLLLNRKFEIGIATTGVTDLNNDIVLNKDIYNLTTLEAYLTEDKEAIIDQLYSFTPNPAPGVQKVSDIVDVANSTFSLVQDPTNSLLFDLQATLEPKPNFIIGTSPIPLVKGIKVNQGATVAFKTDVLGLINDEINANGITSIAEFETHFEQPVNLRTIVDINPSPADPLQSVTAELLLNEEDDSVHDLTLTFVSNAGFSNFNPASQAPNVLSISGVQLNKIVTLGWETGASVAIRNSANTTTVAEFETYIGTVAGKQAILGQIDATPDAINLEASSFTATLTSAAGANPLTVSLVPTIELNEGFTLSEPELAPLEITLKTSVTIGWKSSNIKALFQTKLHLEPTIVSQETLNQYLIDSKEELLNEFVSITPTIELVEFDFKATMSDNTYNIELELGHNPGLTITNNWSPITGLTLNQAVQLSWKDFNVVQSEIEQFVKSSSIEPTTAIRNDASLRSALLADDNIKNAIKANINIDLSQATILDLDFIVNNKIVEVVPRLSSGFHASNSLPTIQVTNYVRDVTVTTDEEKLKTDIQKIINDESIDDLAKLESSYTSGLIRNLIVSSIQANVDNINLQDAINPVVEHSGTDPDSYTMTFTITILPGFVATPESVLAFDILGLTLFDPDPTPPVSQNNVK